jgi:glycosyltransferase involved in cell wall biosynthesis
MIQKSNIKPDFFEISYVGTLYPHQNVELFLEGVKLLVEELDLKKGFWDIN